MTIEIAPWVMIALATVLLPETAHASTGLEYLGYPVFSINPVASLGLIVLSLVSL